MKSYLVKWLIAIVLAVFFLWLSLETDLLPKEAYPLLLVPILIVGLYLFKERQLSIQLNYEKSPGCQLVQALRGFFVYGARTNGLALPFFICGTSDRIGKLDPWSHECPVCEERSYLRLST